MALSFVGPVGYVQTLQVQQHFLPSLLEIVDESEGAGISRCYPCTFRPGSDDGFRFMCVCVCIYIYIYV